MRVLIRVVVVFITGVATLYFVYWVGGALVVSFHWPLWIASVGALLLAALVGRYVWSHTGSLQVGLAHSIFLGALATGGMGFSVGFFGPLLFMPGANEAPVLGIFVTGPVGLLLGAIGGAVYWLARGQRKD
jgi:hypothetical protein